MYPQRRRDIYPQHTWGMTSDSSPISRTISAPSLPAAISNADNARSYELIALLLNIFNALFALLCKLLCGKLLLKTHAHHDRAHIVVDDGLKNSILGILVGNTGIGHAFKADLRSQRKNIRSVCRCFSPYNFPPINNIFCSLGLSIVYIMKRYTLSIIWRWY